MDGEWKEYANCFEKRVMASRCLKLKIENWGKVKWTIRFCRIIRRGSSLRRKREREFKE